jgi:SAM-dependent methyltransferase
LKLTNYVCPSCNSQGLRVFYEAKGIPVNSCIMFSNSREAINFARGDLILGFCENCGFISNVAFDPIKLDYASLVPEEQGFSSTFRAFAQTIATHLIKNYDLHGKHIMEIGCGRGDFLALMCELGHNIGVGVDPSSVAGGVEGDILKNLTFTHDYFSEKYANQIGDFVCCRHTLEHIHNTAEFLNSVRNAIGNRLDTSVFFEVPDVTRILKEVAFWDIYYEHCSYFTLGSLARLFRFCRFEVTNLAKAYSDQYLLIEAKPVHNKSEKIMEVEESIQTTVEDVINFSARCRDKIEKWLDQLKRIKEERKRAVIWGSGSKCVGFMTTLGIKDEIEYIVDINPNRHGKFIAGVGKQIVSPEFIRNYRPDIVIVMNPIYSKEIGQMLEKMGLYPELLPCT